MLTVDCPNCGHVLLGARAILGLTRTPLGLEVRYRCVCGHRGEHLSGRRTVVLAASARPAHPTATTPPGSD